MIAYLKNGGRLYIEGALLGYYNSNGQYSYYGLWDYLGAKYLTAGDYTKSVSITEIKCVPSTFTEGFNFKYATGDIPSNDVDTLGTESSGFIIFKSDGDSGRVIANIGKASNKEYRTIVSSVIFSALYGGEHSRKELISKYLEFLLANVPVKLETGQNKDTNPLSGWLH
ncbi:MAG: hypothetical protein ACUVWP_04545 [bacterium]